jgi:16S rRNA A1518/A1519 N6-dimethyltransferase RsmA/KsgA/DIM1 with predicted DNA glycosylase/AP lyase activity
MYLGKQIFDPHPEVRASVIPLIRDRTDIDPVIWLLQLSHDTDETVRTKAVEALINRDSPEVDRRLHEIAVTDASPTVRAAAGKHIPRSAGESTAALPPLPGSTSLNPKAN